MGFDLQSALEDGYTYDEIAEFLSDKSGFDLQSAKRDGYSSQEIVDFLIRPGSPINPIKQGPAFSGDLHDPQTQEIVESSDSAIVRGVNNIAASMLETMKPVGYAFGISDELKQGIDKLRQPSKIYEEMGYTDIAGKLGDAVPYMIGGGIVGAGKGALGTLAKNIIADATVSTARNIDNPKGVAENVVMDVVGNAAFTGLGQLGKAVYKYLKGIDVSKLTESEVEQLAKKMAQDLNLTIDEAKDVISNAKLRVEKSGGEIVFDPEKIGKKADDYLANKVKEAAQEQIAATKDFGISLSKGQATKSLAQQKFEVEALNGAYGEKAQKIMQEFVNAQNRQIKAVAENIKRTLGDENIDTFTAGNIIKDKTKEIYEQMSRAVDEAYGKVDFNKASIDKKFFDDLHNNIMSLHNAGDVTIDKELTPNTTWALNQIKDIAEKFKDSEGEIPLRDIEILRRRINLALDNSVSKADKRALMAIKSQFDSTLDDFVDNQLLSGDVNVIEQLKVARKKRAEMGKVFDFGAKDSGRKLLSEIINNDITPEHIANYILGKGQLVGNSKSSVEALRFLKSTFGETSDEWKAIKTAGFSRILEAAQNGEYLKAAKLAKQIQQNLLNNKSVMAELYTKDELTMLGKFANAVAATVPDERAFNPSRTAYSIASIVRNYAKSGLLNNPLVKSMSEGIANAKYENLAKKSINYKVPNTNLKGGLRVPFLIALSGGTTGGAYGFTQGDTLEERIGNAAKYGALGAASGVTLTKLLKGETMPAGLSIGIVNSFPVEKANVATQLSVIKNKNNKPIWKAAKEGSIHAAHRLVNKFVKEDSVMAQEIKNIAKTYPNATIVPVAGLEDIKGDTNKIPIALAHKLSKLSGLNKADSIVKIIGGGHTDKTARDRLLSQTLFKGDIKGKHFILVDDQITTGSTLNELRHFIETQGGEVVGVFGLTKKANSDILRITPEQISALEERYGRENLEKILRQTDIAGTIDGLTRGQADYLLRFSTLDGLRDRIFTPGHKDVIQDIGHVRQQADARLKYNPADIYHPKDWESFDPGQAKQYLKQQRNKLFAR